MKKEETAALAAQAAHGGLYWRIPNGTLVPVRSIGSCGDEPAALLADGSPILLDTAKAADFVFVTTLPAILQEPSELETPLDRGGPKMKVTIPRGSTLAIGCDGKDWEFEVHFGSPAAPGGVMVLESAGMPGNITGDAFSTLYLADERQDTEPSVGAAYK